MSPYIYLLTIVENIQLLLAILLVLSIPYYKLVRSIALSIYDPMLFIIFGDWMGSSLVVFMWMQSDISDVHFYYYCFSQVALVLGMLLLRRKIPTLIAGPAPIRTSKLPFLVLLNAAWINITVTLAIWSIAGIPLFRASRIGAFAGSGGLGILERVQSGTILIATFSACFVLGESISQFRKRGAVLFFVWLVIYSAASGSKGSLLVVAQIIFVYIFVFKRQKLGENLFFGGKKGIPILFGATAFALFVIAVQSEGTLIEVVSAFAFRLISYGDIYIYAYINDTLLEVRGDNPLIGLFGGFLSTFRLFPVDMIYTNMGYQLSSIVFPGLDYMSGPNPRHNVFGFHFFGWFGIIYSFLIGCFIVALQRFLYCQVNPTYIGSLLRFLLYFALLSVVGDFDYAMATLADAIISLIVVVFFSLLFYYSNNENNRSTS